MGIKSLFSSDKGGWECQPTEDGSMACQRFEINDNKEKIASGTYFSVFADSQNNCKPVLSGQVSILDADRKKVKEITEQVVKGCRSGLV